MPSPKESFREHVESSPESYYPVDVLRDRGFHRSRCEETGRYFWSTDPDRRVCGDGDVIGEYEFLSEDMADASYAYDETWASFESYFEGRDYTSVDRYPVAARWRDDADFVAASIYDFQPHVVNGDAAPPANPLVVPQFCLRFNDVQNVGVTMSHTTGFVMVGQHAFDTPEGWRQSRYFEDLLDWFTDELGVSEDDLVLHEDVWSGGGNLGASIEFFAGGLELANQVYMTHEVTGDGIDELPIKVLDMGLGLERVAWFSQAADTLYHACFPDTLSEVLSHTGTDVDTDLLQRFTPHAVALNDDETDDVDAAWEDIADALDHRVDELRGELQGFTDAVRVAEYTRSLLVALADGALPSNVRGGHNLRVILRRALSIIRRNDWDLDLGRVASWHAEELSDLYPELEASLGHVEDILRVEEAKYDRTKAEHSRLIEQVVEQGGASDEEIIELYDSHGLDPEELQRRAAEHGVEIDIPDRFWAKVTERHDHSADDHATGDARGRFDEQPETERLYYDHYDDIAFEGVVEAIDQRGDEYHVVLNRSAFYPTSGGQEHDTGTIDEHPVVDVYDEHGRVVHVLPTVSFDEGDRVEGHVDFDRRLQLSQHHSATHILTGVARDVLGDHVWQAGASKTEEKARLDITHYESLSTEDEQRIEEAVNDVVADNLPITHRFYDRDDAEREFGFRIYQGGAVPGDEVRIVSVGDLDHEACGGTHVDVTGDVKHVKLIKSSKKQDGVVRLEFLAGERAAERIQQEQKTIKTLCEELECDSPTLIPGRAEEVFQKWKDIRKDKLDEFEFESDEEFDGDVIDEAASRLKTQRKHVVKTVRKFKDKIDDLLS